MRAPDRIYLRVPGRSDPVPVPVAAPATKVATAEATPAKPQAAKKKDDN